MSTLPTCDAECTRMGWTEYMLYCDTFDLHVSVPPNTDFDGIFSAFCHDEQEMIDISGWMFTAEAI